MSKSVAILGGGVAGLTAAHELVDRGFTVVVVEVGGTVGGKARSFGKPGSATPPQVLLPGEHGFRFFPGFYHHITDSMTAIPIGSKSAFDNLVATEVAGIARPNLPLFRFRVSARQTLAGWFAALQDLFDNPELGLDPGEGPFFASRMFDFITSCDERRLGQWEGVPWWVYVDAANHSRAYQDLLARGLTRSLVAMRAEVASTRTIATILWQMVFSIADPSGAAADRVLNAPTTDAWLEPWRLYLLRRGVAFSMDSSVEGITLAGNHVQSVQVLQGSALVDVSAGHYVFAVPQEIMAALATPSVIHEAPSLAGIASLEVDWMNGIQFYLSREVKVTEGHVILAEAPWALTLLSQRQFWPGVDFNKLGDVPIGGILSVDISDWDAKGTFVNKPAVQCTRDEIAFEVWEQLKSHLSVTAPLMDADRVDFFLDPAIVIGSGPTRNRSPLFTNTCGSWALRPQAVTEIDNLFLASDYVQTYTDLACMEGANEAARRAVNGILDATGSSRQHCALWKLKEPSIFDAAKDFDRILWGRGLPHPGTAFLLQLFGV